MIEFRYSVLLRCALVLTLWSRADARMLDDFQDISGWEALASEGAEVSIDSDPGYTGQSLRLDFNFRATGGYVNVKKPIRMRLPPNYTFSFYLRGNGPPNNLEFKLLDPTERNVWWRNDRAIELEPEWQKREVWQSQIRFAWGPNPGPAVEIGYIEFTIKANKGGAGSVWIDDLEFQRRTPEANLPWPPTVTSSFPVSAAESAPLFDHDLASGWHSDPKSPERQWLIFDLSKTRLFGGLIIDWDPEDYPASFAIAVSDEPHSWRTLFSTANSSGRRSYIYLPSCAARFLRLDLTASHRGGGYGIREIALQPYGFSESINNFFTTIAHDSPPGAHPKYLSEKQSYWTVVGVSGDEKEALINEEGMIEVDAQSFSIEPMLFSDGKVITWNDVRTSQTLMDGYLPIPTVSWEHSPWKLEITAAASGKRGASTLSARYRLSNLGAEEKVVDLYLAVRPFQVNPPWQSLDTFTGATPIWSIERDRNTILVRSRHDAVPQRIELLTPPSRFGAAQMEEGGLLDFVGKGQVPPQARAEGGLGYATGVVDYELRLKPGETREIELAVPWYPGSRADQDADEAIAAARREWSAMLDEIQIDITRLPELKRLLQSTVAYILINRDNAAIQPGSRTYARSWIRDGALTSMALLEMGLRDEVRDFLAWYANHQFASGRIPCCVDARGADPTPEYDADGEFIFAVAEYYHYTGDLEFVRTLWPNVVGAVAHLEELRARRLGDKYRRGDKLPFYGLLPESISHEGYAAHPVHSYWDDFFALRGFADAAALAVALGDAEHAQRYSQLRVDFEKSVTDSILYTVADNAINYIPGSVELGDFDPTATSLLPTIGLEPAVLTDLMRSTFERYYKFFRERETNATPWTNYAPYEFRNVTAFVRLGQRERAAEVMRFLIAGRRPEGWNLWPEIVWRDQDAPRFVGDIPHTWAGSSFISALRSMLVYERLGDNQLVLAAGVPADWLDQDGEVEVRQLPTELGKISYELRRQADGRVEMKIDGELKQPAPHIVLRPPLPSASMRARIDGQPAGSFDGSSLILHHLPAKVVFEPVAP